MNELIRRRAGRVDPRELAREAIAAAEAAGDAKALRERIAEAAGLPVEFGTRLQGDDAGALQADAEQLAEVVGTMRPEKPPETFDDTIRRAAGRPTVDDIAAAEEPPPVTNFDGGARSSTAPPEPSMDDQIRGARDARAQLAHDNALDHQHARR